MQRLHLELVQPPSLATSARRRPKGREKEHATRARIVPDDDGEVSDERHSKHSASVDLLADEPQHGGGVCGRVFCTICESTVEFVSSAWLEELVTDAVEHPLLPS